MLPSVEFHLDRWGTLWVRAHYNDDKGNVALPVNAWLREQDKHDHRGREDLFQR